MTCDIVCGDRRLRPGRKAETWHKKFEKNLWSSYTMLYTVFTCHGRCCESVRPVICSCVKSQVDAFQRCKAAVEIRRMLFLIDSVLFLSENNFSREIFLSSAWFMSIALLSISWLLAVYRWDEVICCHNWITGLKLNVRKKWGFWLRIVSQWKQFCKSIKH